MRGQRGYGYNDNIKAKRVEEKKAEILAHRQKFLERHKLPAKNKRQIGEEVDALYYKLSPFYVMDMKVRGCLDKE